MDLHWLPNFIDWHRGRFDPFDWPAADSDEYVEYLLDWQEAFNREGVGEDEARRASRRLSLAPPKYRREHIPALLQVVATMRAERGALAAPAESREAAAQASKGCRYCDGGGLVTLWHPQPCAERKVSPTVAGHCTCQMGRWMRTKLGGTKDGEALLRRVPDLHEVLTGRAAWRLDPPGHRPMGDGGDDGPGDGPPAGPPWKGPSKAQLNAMFAGAEP